MSQESKRILVIDDNPEDIELLSMQLKANGLNFALQTCEDAQIASDIVKQLDTSTRPDIVVLDLHLPPSDGETVFREIRKNPALNRTPVVIMTTSASPEEVKQFMSHSHTTVITKPFSLEDFGPIVTTIRDLFQSTVP